MDPREETDVPDNEVLPEYSLVRGVRGKYAERYGRGTNLVLLDPDVAEIFPDIEEVNQGPRALASVIRARNGEAA